MTELGTLHPFPRAQADRSGTGASLRSEEPLVPEAAPPELAPVGGLQSLRLGAEVAVRSRWPFMAGLLAVSLLSLPGLLGVGEWAQQSAHAMLGMLLFTYGIARGVDGRSRDRAFWAGLGVRPGAWELGVVLVDLAFLGLVSAAGLALGPDDPVFLLLGLGMALVSYGFGSATRSAATTENGRFGFMLGMLLVLALNAAVAFGFSYGHFAVGVGTQLGLVAAAGLAARVLLSGHAPESAAGRGRRRWGWLGAALTGLLVVPIQFAQGVPETTGAYPQASALLIPDADPMASQQVWWTDGDGDLQRLAVRGRIDAEEPGPHHAVAFRRTPPHALVEVALAHETAADAERALSHGAVSRFGMVTAEGDHIECDAPLLAGTTTFDPDGLGATRVAPSGARWRLDADGCRPLSPGETP